jgi:hypothetical protein
MFEIPCPQFKLTRQRDMSREQGNHLFLKGSLRPFGLVVAFLLSAGELGIAEIYRDIRPYDTRAEVRKKFPGGDFKLLHPAWAQKSDLLYSISGSGLVGTIVVKFTDQVEVEKQYLRDELAKSNSACDKELAKTAQGGVPDDTQPCQRSLILLEQINEPVNLPPADKEARIQIDWVRWAPDTPIPLDRLITLYGQPDNSGVDENTLEPFKEWKRGILASITDDGKSVRLIDYNFTREEKKKEWLIKHPDSHCDTATSYREVGPDGCSLEWLADIIREQAKRLQPRQSSTTPPRK